MEIQYTSLHPLIVTVMSLIVLLSNNTFHCFSSVATPSDMLKD